MSLPRVLAASAAAVFALGLGAGAASAAPATTGPDPYVVVNVTLTDGRIALSRLLVKNVTYVDFIVRNRGKVTHDFSIGGYTTPALKPGQSAHLLVGFPVYGRYSFHSTVHATTAMRGRLKVEAPVLPD